MRTLPRRVICPNVLVAVLLPLAPLVGQTPASRDAIVGQWEGTSICVKAAWNSGCNDEHNVYVFARTAHPDSLAEHAYKQVNGEYDLMGAETVSWDVKRREWFNIFDNGRASIRISYRATDSLLTGTVTDLHTGQVERQVSARRAKGLKLPPD